jgi:hypothetical protein
MALARLLWRASITKACSLPGHALPCQRDRSRHRPFMTDLLVDVDHVSVRMAWTAALIALVMAALVVAERSVFAYNRWRRRRIEQTCGVIAQRALAGDPAALAALVSSPRRLRVPIAWLLINPLVRDRDPDRIARTRTIVDAMELAPAANRLLGSRRWWCRVLALRAVGLLQLRQHTAVVVAALDDPDIKVRAAALDAAALFALVVRLAAAWPCRYGAERVRDQL